MQNFSNVLSNFRNSEKTFEIINSKTIKILTGTENKKDKTEVFIILPYLNQGKIKLKLDKCIKSLENQAINNYSLTFINLEESYLSKINARLLSKEFNANCIFFSGFTLNEKLHITKTLTGDDNFQVICFSSKKTHKYNLQDYYNYKFTEIKTHQNAY